MIHDTSRDAARLHPALRERWLYLKRRWAELHPNEPQPFLTATTRGQIDQEEAFRKGNSRARFGESMHNYIPSYAFDIGFKDNRTGSLDWSWGLFGKAADILEPTGLEWGGRWSSLRDGPHFQMPMTIEDAKRGAVPKLPSLTPVEKAANGAGEMKLVVMRDGEIMGSHAFIEGSDVVVRYAPERKRVYIDVREEGD